MSNVSSVPESPQPPTNPPSYSIPQKRSAALYFNIGILCAIISVVVLPEIFGSAAIILGAYAWRMERDENRNRGLLLIILGIVAMLVGIYYTSYFGLYNILP
jgi:membrane-bound ClpP family serine protease